LPRHPSESAAYDRCPAVPRLPLPGRGQFPVSYRDLERMLADRGVAVGHTTMSRRKAGRPRTRAGSLPACAENPRSGIAVHFHKATGIAAWKWRLLGRGLHRVGRMHGKQVFADTRWWAPQQRQALRSPRVPAWPVPLSRATNGPALTTGWFPQPSWPSRVGQLSALTAAGT